MPAIRAGSRHSFDSRIDDWLASQPDSVAEYQGDTHVFQGSPRAKVDKKRKRETRAKGANISSQREHTKRPKLQEIPGNAMDRPNPSKQPAPRGRKARDTAQHEASASPTARRRQRTGRLPSNDLEATPRPRLPSLGVIPVFGQEPAASRSSTASSSKAPSSPSRSRSPTKKMTDLQLADIKVIMKAFGTPGITMSQSARELRRKMQDIEERCGIIPAEMEARIVEHMKWDEADLSRRRGWFRKEEEMDIKNNILHDGLGYEATWQQVKELHAAAMDAQNRGFAEPGWNMEVHAPLWKLALRGYWRSKGVWYSEVTTAKISDASLLPAIAAKTLTFQGKMVDFAMVIEPSEELLDRILEKLASEARIYSNGSINHAAADPIRFAPIAISMETKRAAVDEENANIQLATWVSAHFARLNQLTCGKAEMPILPCIIAQGHDWKFMIAERQRTGVCIFRQQSLGSTDSVVGIYQVLTAIQNMARWAEKDYWSWFKSEVLDVEDE
jgi:hypothetical protein